MPPLYYPIGICYIASYLRENGYKVKILDINGYRWTKAEFKKVFEKESVDAIGIGGLVTAFNHVDWVSDYIKSIKPDIPIFAGNTVASTIPKILLKHTKVDITVLGEGEHTTLELIERLENDKSLEGLEGIWYRDNNGKIIENPKREPIKDLDALPFPAWDLVPMETYLKNQKVKFGYRSIELSTIRGCPNNCSFCCKTFIGYKVRRRSPESCIEEIKLLVEKYNIEGFNPNDDLFIYDKKRVVRFCDLLIKEDLDYLSWNSSARVDLITKELAETMKSAGCASLIFGFESNSQKVLDYYNKQCTVKDQQRAIDICNVVGIACNKSYMIGARNEDEESIKETVEFCEKNNYRFYPTFFLMPLPQTKIYEECIQRGLITNELEYIKKIARIGDAANLIINVTEKFSDEELINIFNKYRERERPSGILNLIKYSGKSQALKKYGLKHVFKYVTNLVSGRYSKRPLYANEWT